MRTREELEAIDPARQDAMHWKACAADYENLLTKRIAESVNRVAVTNVLDRAHQALRRIDAGDPAFPVPPKDLDAVSDGIAAIEEFCRERYIPLSEFAKVDDMKEDGSRYETDGVLTDKYTGKVI